MTGPAVLETDLAAWRAEALELVERFASAGAPFTCDSLRTLLPEPHHSGAYGAVFRTAHGRGLITEVRSRPSSTRSRREGRLLVWVGVDPHITPTGGHRGS